jgi:uncharacterized protein
LFGKVSENFGPFVIIKNMKIGIISDTHNNLPKFKKAMDYLEKKKVSLVIHCGDIANPKTLKESLKGFSGKCKGVLGNADNIYQYELKDYQSSKAEIFEGSGEIEIKGAKIAFTHYPWEAKKLAKSKKYEAVFYGHTHRPWQKKIGDCLVINPGNVAGVIFRPTFAVYDTEKKEAKLKLLEKI